MRAPLSSYRVLAHLSAFAICLSACRESASTPVARLIRVGYSGEADFGDLPSFIAHERLRARGYRIEPTFFSAPDVNVASISSAAADIMHGSMISAWTAIGRGARIRTVMSHVANPYRLITAPEISTCAALSGRLLALAVESSVSTHLVRAFINEECPAIRPDTLFVAESSNRAAAFLTGEVAAVALDLSSLLWLQRQDPGRLRVMSDFSSRWPSIKTTGVHVNIDFARDHPDMLIDYLRALLAANRDVVAAPGLLTAAASEKMGRSGDWAATAQAYLAAGAWPTNGGLTSEDVESTLEFFKNNSHLDQRLTKDSVADLKFLEAALADFRERRP